MQFVLMMMLVTGTGSAAHLELKPVQTFDTMLLCDQFKTATETAARRATEVAKAEINFNMACARVK